MSRKEKFSKEKWPDTSHQLWCVADEPLHKGGSHKATTSEMPSMVSGVAKSNGDFLHPPFPPLLIKEPSSGSLWAAMSSRRLPVPIRQVAFDTWGKPTVAWVPRIPNGQQYTLPSQNPQYYALYGSPLDPSADTPRAMNLEISRGVRSRPAQCYKDIVSL